MKDQITARPSGGEPAVSRRRLLGVTVPAGVVAINGLTRGTAAAQTPSTRADAQLASSAQFTTIAMLRSLTQSAASDCYFVTDPGQEGLFRADPVDTTSPDNTGTVLVTASGQRFKRAFDGVLSVRWFGARGDGGADDLSAIQSAIDTAQVDPTEMTVWFPRGTYAVSGPIEIAPTKGLRIVGDGYLESIVTLTADTAHATALFDVLTTAESSYLEFADLRVDGTLDRRADYGIHGEKLCHASFRRVQFWHAAIAGLAIGYGWCNYINECVFEANYDGVLGTPAGSLNILRITNSNFESNNRFGVNLNGLGHGVRIEGCTIEGNAGCGIFVSAWIDSLEIIANYFELNAATGYAFTNPARTVKAQIVITGSADSTSVNYVKPPGAIRVAGNYSSASNFSGGDALVACYASYGSLEVIGNTIDDYTKRTAPVYHTIVSTGTSNTGDGARVEGLLIRGNGSPAGRGPAIRLTPVEVQDLAGGSTALHEAVIDNVARVNYSPPLARFRPLERQTRGHWTLGAGQYRLDEIWTLTGASGSGGWGFVLNIDDHPELAGAYVYFALAARVSDTSTTLALSTGQLGAGAVESFADVSWRVISYVDQMPTTGPVSFGVEMVAGPPTGTAYLARPVLSEIGVNYLNH